MKSSRRRFLQIAGISALGLGAKPVFNAFAKEDGKLEIQTLQSDKALKAKQWAMVIDTRKLESAETIEPIIEACNKIHNIPTKIEDKRHEVKWIWEEGYHHAFPGKANRLLRKPAMLPGLSYRSDVQKRK